MKFRLGFIILILIFASSCTENVNKITADERLMIDTMSANKVAKLKLIWDEDCMRKKDSMVHFAVDSLTRITLEKIDQKIKPYHE